MKQILGLGVAAGLALAFVGCGSGPQATAPRAGATEGSTAYFFELLDDTDAAADYFTRPVSLADLLPNRTYRVLPRGASNPEAVAHTFAWSQRVVVGRVTGVRNADRNRRLRLTISIAESFPATSAKTIDVEVGSFPEYADQYLVSASALDRVVVGIDVYDNDAGEPQVVVARTGHLIGVVDDEDRITWPILRPDDFEDTEWDQGMTTLDGLRAQASAAPTTVTVRR